MSRFLYFILLSLSPSSFLIPAPSVAVVTSVSSVQSIPPSLDYYKAVRIVPVIFPGG